MNLRELVILILGLAMVVVVARGLLVALRARRNQIKLAIDKNIPRDIDLDALEMAELPSGGARIVRRESVATSQTRDTSASKAEAEADAGDEEEPVVEELVLPDDTHSFDELLSEPSLDAGALEEEAPIAQSSEDMAHKDAVLEEEVFEEESFEDKALEEEFAGDEILEAADPVEAAQQGAVDALEDSLEDSLEDALEDALEDDSAAESEREETNDGDLAPFTLSAGERIGGRERKTPAKPSRASSLLGSAKRTLGALVPKKSENDAEADDRYEQDEIAEWQEDEQGDPITLDSEPLVSVPLAIAAEPQRNPEAIEQDDQDAQGAEYGQDERGEQDELDEEEGPGAQEASGDEGLAASLFEGYDSDQVSPDLAAGHADLFPETFDANAAHDAALEQEQTTKRREKAASKAAKSAAAKSVAAKSAATERAKAQVAALQPEDAAIERSAEEPKEKASPTVASPSEVLIINVTAKKGRLIMGDRLMPLLLSLGLKFGERKIFSKRVGDKANGEVLFNVANGLNPGTFDLNHMDSFSTVGVALFLALPTSINNLDAFQQMLDVAQDLVGSLDAELRDDQRNIMSAQTIEHYRQRVRDFELQRLRARAAAG